MIVPDTLSDISSSEEEEIIRGSAAANSQISQTCQDANIESHLPHTFPVSLSQLLKMKNKHCNNKGTFNKYWRRRYDLFERFDLGIELDEESWYSVTPESIARHQSKTCSCDFLIDAFAGVGGNTIQFAQTCTLVLAIENNFTRLLMLAHNAKLYGVSKNIMLVCGDVERTLRSIRTISHLKLTYLSTVSKTSRDKVLTTDVQLATSSHADQCAVPPETMEEQETKTTRVADILFMSPPWGGPDYTGVILPPGSNSWNVRKRQQWLKDRNNVEPTKNIEEVSLLTPVLKIARHICDRFVIYLPRNSSIGQILQLGWPIEPCTEVQCSCKNYLDVHIESYCIRGRHIALGVYLGHFAWFTLNTN